MGSNMPLTHFEFRSLPELPSISLKSVVVLFIPRDILAKGRPLNSTTILLAFFLSVSSGYWMESCE